MPVTYSFADVVCSITGPGGSFLLTDAMTPGGFDVDAYLRSQPMGAGSTTNDNSRSVTMNSPINVTVNGSTDPAATGAAVGRAVGQAGELSLRNVSTAIR